MSSGGDSTGGFSSDSSTGGAPSGGTSGNSGGTTENAGAGGTDAAAGGTSSGGQSGTGGSNPTAGIKKLGESVVADNGLTVVSYGGYLNGESFQQDGILTEGGVQYAAYWNSARHVVIAARTLPDGPWSRLELDDYTNTADDAHNTISLGVAPGDGTLHLSFDHHDDNLNYRRSGLGLLDEDFSSWTTADFGTVTDVLGSAPLTSVTYPRFITAPDGQSLMLSMRIGASGNGTARLFEYATSSQIWSDRGSYVDGASVDENPYFHGIAFDTTGDRLHFAWCDRATPDPATNHDLFYAYSEDRGATLKNAANEVIATISQGPLVATSPDALAVSIAQNRGLINQEHMTVDAEGGVHVLLTHMAEGQDDDLDFESARNKSFFFHYYLEPGSTNWNTNPLGAAVIANFRGKLALSSSGNVYAILPNLRIYGASKKESYQDWTLLESQNGFFSDPLIDARRLLDEDTLTVFYPLANSAEILALDYELQ